MAMNMKVPNDAHYSFILMLFVSHLSIAFGWFCGGDPPCRI